MKLRKIAVPFTQVANNILIDPKISWKAKGLFSYLMSKPDGWDFATKRISEEGSDGLKSTSSGLQELEENGYLARNRQTNGRMEYLLSYERLAKVCPEVQNGTVTKRQSDKTGHISNKESISNKDNKETTTKVVEAEASQDEKITDLTDNRNSDVQAIIDTIKANHGTVDGTVKEQRQYAYLLSKKVKEIHGFSEKFGDVWTFVNWLIKNSDQYKRPKTTSPKKIYYDLGEFIASIRAKNTPKQEKNINVW